MGYGGALIWTAFAHNLKNEYPDKQIVFLYKRALPDFLLGKPHPDHIVYENNEDISCIVDSIAWHFKKWQFKPEHTIIVDMSNPVYNYAKGDSETRTTYKTGRHAIQIACGVHGISNAKLQPKIQLTKEEIDKTNDLLEANALLKNHFICIEPHTKKSFTPNKAWFWEKWERLVELINQYISNNHLFCKLVQIGVATDKILDGVVNLAGKTSFRETAHILKNSIVLISCLGGLVHLSKAVGGKNIVVVSAWEPLELASYPDDINFYTDIDCKNCGLKIPCPINRKCMEAIIPEQVFEAVKSVLKDLPDELSGLRQ
jgi:ADP-heptose:LPS heptosyltransferase